MARGSRRSVFVIVLLLLLCGVLGTLFGQRVSPPAAGAACCVGLEGLDERRLAPPPADGGPGARDEVGVLGLHVALLPPVVGRGGGGGGLFLLLLVGGGSGGGSSGGLGVGGVRFCAFRRGLAPRLCELLMNKRE